MKQYMYEVSSMENGSELIYKTNNIYEALQIVLDCWDDSSTKVDIINGYTGEVLLHSNFDDEEEVYMTKEMRLMWLGFMTITGD